MNWRRQAALLSLAVVPFNRTLGAQVHCPASSEPRGTTTWAAPLDRIVAVHAHRISLRDALGRAASAARVRLSYSAEALPLDTSVCFESDSISLGGALVVMLGSAGVVPRNVAPDHVALVPVGRPAGAGASSNQLAPMLDRVVVTGTTIGAPRRELPVALDVVDGRRMAREEPDGTLSQALETAVPGIWMWKQSPAAVLSRYGSIRGASSFGVSYPKVYVDGIEVANPLVVTDFAPEMIERIEVIRGPQGAALYGTDAISGVINIVTRTDGVAGGGFYSSLHSQAGGAQSDFATATAVAQHHSVGIRAGSSTRSAGFGVTVGGVGAYVPAARSRQVSASAGGRLVGGRSVVSASARFFADDAGVPVSPLLADSVFGSLDSATIAARLTGRNQSVRHYTLGLSGRLMGNERWTHTALVGIDGYRLSGVEDDVTPIPQIADLTVRLANGGGSRASVRLSSVMTQAFAHSSLALTFAAEHSVLNESGDDPAILVGQPGAQPRGPRYDVGGSWTSSGVLAQANASYRNALYLTGGARIEKNGGFTANATSLLPLIGGAFVREAGGATMKLRAAYGRGIRPQRNATRETNFVGTRGQSHRGSLQPEEQSGVEAGVDVFFKRRFALQVTRFDQLASGLIQRVIVGADTTRRGRRGARAVGYELQNVGQITNRGWEFDGSAAYRALSLEGTLSLVDSRVRQVSARYSGDLRAGDRTLEVPSRTTSLTARWTASSWTASTSVSRASDWVNYDRLGIAWAVVNGLHPSPIEMGGWLRGFWDRYEGVTRVRASLSRDLVRGITLLGSGDNLLGYQLGEPDNVTVLPGRTIALGVRVTF